MACIIIEFPRRAITVPRDDPSLAAVGLCEGDPERLFDLAFVSMTIAKGSDDRAADPTAAECLETAFVALSELLGITGEQRA
jgi:hypothetical protein